MKYQRIMRGPLRSILSAAVASAIMLAGIAATNVAVDFLGSVITDSVAATLVCAVAKIAALVIFYSFAASVFGVMRPNIGSLSAAEIFRARHRREGWRALLNPFPRGDGGGSEESESADYNDADDESEDVPQGIGPADAFVPLARIAIDERAEAQRRKESDHDSEIGSGRLLLMMLGSLAALIGIGILSSYAFARLDIPVVSAAPYDISDEGLTGGIIITAVSFIVSAVSPAVLEETFYRGCLLPGMLNDGVQKTVAAVVSACLFAASHQSASLMPTAFAAGLIFAALAIKTRGIAVPFAVHLTYNAVVFALAAML